MGPALIDLGLGTGDPVLDSKDPKMSIKVFVPKRRVCGSSVATSHILEIIFQFFKEDFIVLNLSKGFLLTHFFKQSKYLKMKKMFWKIFSAKQMEPQNYDYGYHSRHTRTMFCFFVRTYKDNVANLYIVHTSHSFEKILYKLLMIE